MVGAGPQGSLQLLCMPLPGCLRGAEALGSLDWERPRRAEASKAAGRAGCRAGAAGLQHQGEQGVLQASLRAGYACTLGLPG